MSSCRMRGRDRPSAPPDVRAIVAGPHGSMWVSTTATVWRVRGNTAVPLDRPNGLPSDKAFAILDDGAGTLWMTSNKGLRAASISDLDAFADGRLAVLPSRLFGTSDGMVSAECMLASPGRRAAGNGTVWFSDYRGSRARRPGAPAAERAARRRSSSKASPSMAGRRRPPRRSPSLQAAATSRSATPR